MRPAAALGGLLLLAGVAGCGSGEPSGPQDVVVRAGTQEVSASPTQACLDGEGQRYEVTPPIIEVSPDTTIRLTVPDALAEDGWSVQVFDDQLTEQLGEVEVDAGTTVFDDINSSDVVPPAFYLVVVQDAEAGCDGFSGAWPIGFIRAGGPSGGMATAPPTTPPPG
ncbi:DUF2771 family protein [Geodermatophilus ruber]|uniref:DUF2771 family protein n=1 Tax=Geodermatophilus ruber TaxID=504800 RepID=A0A1I4CZZ4_9ACTN|nr:DUF2771 family protein [Geodermatophilus ruber]SFK86924.1 Protein of unknown function [Geodermatophilus ruber]